MRSSSAVLQKLIDPDMGTLTNDGKITVIVRWDMQQVENAEGHLMYEYQEEWLWRQLPPGIRTLELIEEYFEPQYDQLLMLAGADVMVQRLADMEAAILDLAIGGST